MAIYRVEFTKSAAKDVADLSKPDAKRVLEAIKELENEPRPTSSKKLHGVLGYRVRVGDRRIVYTVDDTAKVVTITRVRDRGEVYR